MSPRAAYVHIPFCAHKCGYCDFASLAGADALADRYLDALEAEFRMRLKEPRAVETIFVGGGTPTRLDAGQLHRLVEMLTRWLPLMPGGEWSVEANPGTLDAEKVDVLARGGVTRMSLGAQSFRRESLAVLERNHDPSDVPRAVELIRDRFAHWSLDLIFGVPGSTPSDWKIDLERALELRPGHLSCYGLVYEKGTALWKQREAGTVRPIDEDVEYEMYEHTIARLNEAGFDHYEISNFARPGAECRHNLVYWKNGAYYGLGLGAARFVGGERAINTRDLPAYLRRIEAGEDPTGPRERLEAEAFARETLVLMLRRLSRGVARREFADRTGFELDSLCGEQVARFKRDGLVEDDGDRVRLTRRGVFLADTVLSALV